MDKNVISYCGERPLGIRDHGIIAPPDESYSDSLKITDCDHGYVRAIRIFGGAEDCLDVNNRCRNIEVSAGEWHSGGKYVCTIKGGSENITVGGIIVKHGSEVDVDIGNRSDQSDNTTRGVALDFSTRDGSPVTVRVLNAERPRILNPGQPYRFVLVFGPTVGSIWQKLFNQFVKLFGKH